MVFIDERVVLGLVLRVQAQHLKPFSLEWLEIQSRDETKLRTSRSRQVSQAETEAWFEFSSVGDSSETTVLENSHLARTRLLPKLFLIRSGGAPRTGKPRGQSDKD